MTQINISIYSKRHYMLEICAKQVKAQKFANVFQLNDSFYVVANGMSIASE